MARDVVGEESAAALKARWMDSTMCAWPTAVKDMAGGGGGMDGLAERRTTLTRRHFVNSTILMGCRTPPVMGSAAPHQCPHETTASFVGYADVRTFD